MKNKIYLIAVISIVFSLIACNEQKKFDKKSLDKIAEHYVKLVLSTGKYDKDEVDAYFGPETWKNEAKNWNLSLNLINSQTDSLYNKILLVDTLKLNTLDYQRYKFLKRMILTLSYKTLLLLGKKMTFDEESMALFNVVARKYPQEKYNNILNNLEKLIPGNGSLQERFINYRKQFIIPADKIDTVFKTAIAEGRRRTLSNINMLVNETFTIEYVSNKSWGGYNWFKGNATSLIQVNIDLPIYIERAIDLACHEGYPGHHVYHSLIAENYVNRNKWMEFSVYPLFSPEGLLSEGLANFGVNVAFSKDDQIKFEKEVLFPLAGLNPNKADEYYNILDMMQELNYATIDIARNYLDGKASRFETIEKLMKYKLRSKEHAEVNIKFFEQYRSYIINYYIGEELCRNWVESRGGTESNPKKRWDLFKELMSRPILPSELLK